MQTWHMSPWANYTTDVQKRIKTGKVRLAVQSISGNERANVCCFSAAALTVIQALCSFEVPMAEDFNISQQLVTQYSVHGPERGRPIFFHWAICLLSAVTFKWPRTLNTDKCGMLQRTKCFQTICIERVFDEQLKMLRSSAGTFLYMCTLLI